MTLPEAAGPRYWAFISYSHADTSWAKWIHANLERLPIDKDLVGRRTATGEVPKSLRPIFRDRDEFAAGHALRDQTKAALDSSAALVVVCSPAAARSRYVDEEVRLFKANRAGRPIIPVIVDGQPGAPDRECFPPALRFEVTPHGVLTEQPSEVLAADIRHNADGRQLALAKIAASIIGVGTDDLFRRTERARKRQQRFRVGIGAFLLALVLAGGLLAWLNHLKQTTIAEIEALVAKYAPIDETQVTHTRPNVTEAITAIAQGAGGDARYRQALDLLKAGKPEQAEPLLRAVAEEKAARILRDRRDAVAAFRHLGAIAGLADPKRAHSAYAKALEIDPTDPESLYWHGLLSLLAGDLGTAEHSLNQLMAGAVTRNAIHDIYRAHLRLGEIELAKGNLAEAVQRQSKALTIAETLAAAEPTNTEKQRDYSISLEKVGDLSRAQGNLLSALENYRASFAIRRRLTQADPHNAAWQRDLSVSYNRIADVLRAQGNLTAAVENYRAALDIRVVLANANPHSLGWQRDVSISRDKIGNVLQAVGKMPDALENYIAALIIRERLTKEDGTNAIWQHDLSVSQENIADVLHTQGNLLSALENYRASLAIRRRLTQADPHNAVWQRDLSVSYSKIGDVLRSQDELPAALEHYTAAFNIIGPIAKAHPANATWQADFAINHFLIGQVHAVLGNKHEALRILKDGREILASVAQNSGNASWQLQLTRFDRAIIEIEKY